MPLIPYAGAERKTRSDAKPTKSKRVGFGHVDPAAHRERSAKGGRAVPAEKRTFFRDRDLALAAARKGGLARQAKLREQGATCPAS